VLGGGGTGRGFAHFLRPLCAQLLGLHEKVEDSKHLRDSDSGAHAASTPGLGSPQPQLHWDWAHIGTGTIAFTRRSPHYDSHHRMHMRSGLGRVGRPVGPNQIPACPDGMWRSQKTRTRVRVKSLRSGPVLSAPKPCRHARVQTHIRFASFNGTDVRVG
jgi:hypothetical protein